MFPNPTKGDMMPPTAKPAVPRSAEATPAFSLSHSMANVLEAVKVMPAIERRAKTNVSYIQKLHPCDRAASHAKDSHNMPLLPMCNASFIVGNLTATVEAMAMAMAFAPASFLFPGIKIKDISVVDKSYPNYWKDLCKAGFSLEKDEKEGTRL